MKTLEHRIKQLLCISDGITIYSQKQRVRSAVLVYTFLFAVTAILVFSPFLYYGKTFIREGDGFLQHFKALTYFSEWLKAGFKTLFTEHRLSFPTFAFSVGQGSDIITTLHYYVVGDPVNLLSVLVPERGLIYFYDAMILLRLYLAGLAFTAFCLYTNKATRFGTVAGAIVYTFCGFALFASIRHPYFTNPMIYLPLLLLGVEKVIRQRKPWTLIFAAFVCAVSNFYFFYMLVLLTILYTVVRLFIPFPKNQLKKVFCDIGAIFTSSLIGVLLAAFILVPVVLLFLGNGRASVDTAVDLFYSAPYYKNLLFGFTSWNNMTGWTLLNYSFIVLPAICLLFRKNRSIRLKIALVCLTACLLLPFAGHVFNGFSYVTNRWVFGYSFLIACIVATTWKDFLSISKKEAAVFTCCLLVYFPLCMVVGNFRSLSFIASGGLCLLFVILVLLFSGDSASRCKTSVKFQTAVLSLVIISVTANALSCYLPAEQGYVEEFKPSEEVNIQMSQTGANAVKEIQTLDQDFFRYSVYHSNIEKNASLISGLSSTQYYWSLTNGNAIQYYNDLLVDLNSLSEIKGVDHRTMLEQLASVKYYVTPSSSFVPYGFKRVAEKKTAALKKADTHYIYENQHTLPLGYTYSSYITRENYEKLTPFQRQEALMQGLVLEQAPAGYARTDLKLTGKPVDCTVKCTNSQVTQQGNRFVVTKRNASVTLEFNGLENAETYLYFSGLKFTGHAKYELYGDHPSIDPLNLYTDESFKSLPKDTQKQLKRNSRNYQPPAMVLISLTAKTASFKTVKRSFSLISPHYSWYHGREDYLLNLSYSDEAKTSVTITFPYIGVYSFDSLQVLCQPMNDSARQVAALSEDVMQNTNLHLNDACATNLVTGTISLDRDKLLCLTIPYSDGWTAYVDQEKAELLQANGMYMALDLKQGDHDIRLEYTTPGLVYGMILSALGLIMTVILAVCRCMKKQRQNEKSKETKNYG